MYTRMSCVLQFLTLINIAKKKTQSASLAQLAEHMLRKHRVVGSIPTGGYVYSSCTVYIDVGLPHALATHPKLLHIKVYNM